MSQHELRTFQFRKGFKVIQRIECDWVEARRTGNELADELGYVELCVYNDPMRRWEPLGTFKGNMRYTNSWGDECIINNDFSGLTFAKKAKKGDNK